MLKNIVRNSVQFVPWRLRSVIKQIPIVAQVQRWLLAQVLEGTEFVHVVNAGPAKGLKTIVQLPADKGIWTGTYELDFVQSLAAAIRPGDVCFDVGGWHGFCGGVMALNGASKTVIFEPMPPNCERICKLIQLNPKLNIQLFQGAAGEMNGRAAFHVLDADSMGKLDSSSFQKEVAGKTIDVELVSLDTWCNANSVAFPNVMKIDVEGAELMVLRGAINILKTTKPTLFIEAHSRELAREVVKLLEQFGYAPTTLETGRKLDSASEPEVCHIVAT